MVKKSGWLPGVLLVLTGMLVAGCSAEKQTPGFTQLTELPALNTTLPVDPRYEPLSPVMRDTYDRSIPEDVYSAE
jgi:hypothetical protein